MRWLCLEVFVLIRHIKYSGLFTLKTQKHGEPLSHFQWARMSATMFDWHWTNAANLSSWVPGHVLTVRNGWPGSSPPPLELLQGHIKTSQEESKSLPWFFGIWVHDVSYGLIKFNIFNWKYIIKTVFKFQWPFYLIRKSYKQVMISSQDHLLLRSCNVCVVSCSHSHAAVSFRTSRSFDSKWVNWCMLPWLLDVSRLTVGKKNESLHFLARGHTFASENKIFWNSHAQ